MVEHTRPSINLTHGADPLEAARRVDDGSDDFAGRTGAEAIRRAIRKSAEPEATAEQPAAAQGPAFVNRLVIRQNVGTLVIDGDVRELMINGSVFELTIATS